MIPSRTILPCPIAADDESDSTHGHYYYFKTKETATTFLNWVLSLNIGSGIEKTIIKNSTSTHYTKSNINLFCFAITQSQYQALKPHLSPSSNPIMSTATSNANSSSSKSLASQQAIVPHGSAATTSALAASSSTQASTSSISNAITSRQVISNSSTTTKGTVASSSPSLSPSIQTSSPSKHPRPMQNRRPTYLGLINILDNRKFDDLKPFEGDKNTIENIVIILTVNKDLLKNFLSCQIIYLFNLINAVLSPEQQKTFYSQLTNPIIDTLIKRSDETILRIIFPYIDFRHTPLQEIFQRHSNQVCEGVIHIISESNMLLAHECKFHRANEKPLHTAFLYRSPSVALKLLNRYSPTQLASVALTTLTVWPQDTNLLDCALLYQTAEVTRALIHRLSDVYLACLLKNEHTATLLSALIINEFSFEGILLQRLFRVSPLISELLKNRPTPPSIKSLMLESHANYRMQVQLLGTLERLTPEPKLRYADLEDMPTPDAARALWRRGFQSMHDYDELILSGQFHENRSLLIIIATELERARLILQGCGDFPFDDTFFGEAKEMDMLQNHLKEMTLTSKIIASDTNLKDFKRQMDNPHYRADLRIKTSKEGFKFVHLSNEVIEYKSTKRLKPAYHHSIKQPWTLHTSKMRSFGIIRALKYPSTYSLVGVLGVITTGKHQDVRYSRIKAMLGKDYGTFYREWVGSQIEVEAYQGRIQDSNFTSLESFQRFVRENPYRLNEMLLQSSKESLKAIIVSGPDTFRARKEARSYLSTLGLPLIIVFQDPINCHFRLYSKKEQQEDELVSRSSLRISYEMYYLSELKNQLHAFYEKECKPHLHFERIKNFLKDEQCALNRFALEALKSRLEQNKHDFRIKLNNELLAIDKIKEIREFYQQHDARCSPSHTNTMVEDEKTYIDQKYRELDKNISLSINVEEFKIDFTKGLTLTRMRVQLKAFYHQHQYVTRNFLTFNTSIMSPEEYEYIHNKDCELSHIRQDADIDKLKDDFKAGLALVRLRAQLKEFYYQQLYWTRSSPTSLAPTVSLEEDEYIRNKYHELSYIGHDADAHQLKNDFKAGLIQIRMRIQLKIHLRNFYEQHDIRLSLTPTRTMSQEEMAYIDAMYNALHEMKECHKDTIDTLKGNFRNGLIRIQKSDLIARLETDKNTQYKSYIHLSNLYVELNEKINAPGAFLPEEKATNEAILRLEADIQRAKAVIDKLINIEGNLKKLPPSANTANTLLNYIAQAKAMTNCFALENQYERIQIALLTRISQFGTFGKYKTAYKSLYNQHCCSTAQSSTSSSTGGVKNTIS